MTISEQTKAIESALKGHTVSWELMCAAIEGVVIASAYRLGTKVNSRTVTITALQSLVEGVERTQWSERLGLSV